MEETIKRLKNVFGNEATGIKTTIDKVAFAAGYMKDNDNLTRKEAIEIIEKITMNKL